MQGLLVAACAALLACGARSEVSTLGPHHGAPEASVIDAAPPDVAVDGSDSDVDAACHIDAGTFACGSTTCDSNVAYCVETGPTLTHDFCRALATPCNATCIVGYVVEGCSCDDQGGRITVKCQY